MSRGTTGPRTIPYAGLAALLAGAALLAACSPLDAPIAPAVVKAPVAPRRAPLRWVRAEGAGLVDEAGAPVRLTGVDLSNECWGTWIWPRSEERQKQGQDPMFRPTVQAAWALMDGDFERIAALPGNVVRYDINHELFADENPQREANLAQLVGHIERFGSLGIGVILDLSLPVGLDVQSDNFERKKPGAARERTLIEDDAFFAATVRLWTFLAGRLASEPTLVAYEIYNEPRAPCDAEGGVARFQQRSEALARAIRTIDPRHLVLVPEYNSREANPGESYPNPSGEGNLVDAGEQGIRWDRGLVKVDVPNVGYVFHVYEPWSFAGAGAADFSAPEVEASILRRIAWRDETGHAPLVVTEYGVNWQQPPARRVAWLRIVDDLFAAHDISATYFNYKAAMSPWVRPDDTFALYGQYVGRDEFGSGAGKAYRLRADAEVAARRTGFDRLLERWFIDLGPRDATVMNNGDVVAELARFAKASKPSLGAAR